MNKNTKTIYTILMTIISIFLVSKGFANDPLSLLDAGLKEVQNGAKIVGFTVIGIFWIIWLVSLKVKGFNALELFILICATFGIAVVSIIIDFIKGWG